MDEHERWEQLFADIEGELDGLTAAERDAEVVSRARIDVGRRSLSERIVATTGASVRVGVAGVVLDGVVRDAGPDWLLLARPDRLLASAAVSWIDGLVTPAIAPPLGEGVAARFDLRMALRRLARQREGVRIMLCDSTSHDGVIARVGADHLDLTLASRSLRTVPLASVAWVALAVSR